jgi:hypothetical protein
MSEKNNFQELKNAQSKKLDRKLDTLGWGLFFIWIGVAFLADVGWGAGLIGVGLIILGTLVAREYLSGSVCSEASKPNLNSNI